MQSSFYIWFKNIETCIVTNKKANQFFTNEFDSSTFAAIFSGNLVLSMFPAVVVLTGAQAPTALTWRACRQNGRPSVRVGGTVTDGVRVFSCGATPRTSVPEQYGTSHASDVIVQLMATIHLSRLPVLFTEIACSYPGSFCPVGYSFLILLHVAFLPLFCRKDRGKLATDTLNFCPLFHI